MPITPDLFSKTGMTLDGILGSAAIDSSGEILNIEGADISDWERGRMLLNWEHRGTKDKDHTANDIVGKVVYAKKIFKATDCETDRQRKYWDKIQLPFIYGVCRLFDKADHENAKSIAAIIRDNHANGEPLNCEFSIEGHTLKQDGNVLKKTIVRKVAVTVSACNKTANGELLSDPAAPAGFDSNPVKNFVGDDANPFKKLGKSYESTFSPILEGADPVLKTIKAIIKAKALMKAMEAGMPMGAPSSLVQGAALQREDGSRKKRALQVLSDYTKDRQFNKADFRSALKTSMPEVDDEFLDYFSDLAEDSVLKLKIKKNYPTELVCNMEVLSIRIKDVLDKFQKAEGVTVPEKQAAKLPRAMGTTLPGSKPQKSFDLPKLETPPHKFNGKGVWPGEARIRNAAGRMDTHHIIGEHDDNYVVVPNGMLHNYSQSDVKFLPKSGVGTKYVLSREPRFIPPAKVTKEHATNPLINKDQENLIHGMDLSNRADKPSDMAHGVTSAQWVKAPNGKDAYVKAEMPDDKWANGGFPHPIREHIYHNMAHNFFGLGDYVAPTVAFRHPETGEPMVASEKVADMQHFDENNRDHHETLKKLNQSGELDKIGLMNLIMGQADRHGGNYKLSKNGLKLIDHGLSFEQPKTETPPHYWAKDKTNNFYEPLHPEAAKWLKGLDSQKFDEYLTKEGVPLSYRQEAGNRLNELKSAAHVLSRNGATDVAEGATHDARYPGTKYALKETAR
jgi:hypothetical protein